jgi:uncharacterized metal-binding protein YceD (DUF177 family)
MIPSTTGPLSRLVAVDRLPPAGLEIEVVAKPEEREALARDFNLPGIEALTGRYKITGSLHRVQVRGRVTAQVTQTCSVTLDPFEATVDEEVEVDFTEPDALPEAVAAEMEKAPTQDEIVNGRIDLGSLTAEFLALGLDPYPKKPGVDFAFAGEADPADSPFAALGKLKPNG